jgi:hypothetical protein
VFELVWYDVNGVHVVKSDSEADLMILGKALDATGQRAEILSPKGMMNAPTALRAGMPVRTPEGRTEYVTGVIPGLAYVTHTGSDIPVPAHILTRIGH